MKEVVSDYLSLLVAPSVYMVEAKELVGCLSAAVTFRRLTVAVCAQDFHANALRLISMS
jgi:hypothetical protein